MRKNMADIDERKDDLLELLEGDRALARTFWEKLDLSWVFHENGLEGIVITAEELSTALNGPRSPTEVGKAAFLADIRRQRDALEVVKEEAQNPRGKLNLTLVKTLFETLTGGEEGKGKIEYRRDMPLHRTYFHEILQPPKIVPELTRLIEWAATAEFAAMHPLQQAAVFHHRFMAIFPFTDLSGKVGRLLMNTLVMRAGYLPAVIHSIDRQRYYESLKQPPRALQLLVTEAIEHATDLGFKLLSAPPAERSRAGNY